MSNGSLMKVKSIAEWSILQYFCPALSDNVSWKPIFGFLFDMKYSRTCLKRPLKIDKTKVLMTNGSLMKV